MREAFETYFHGTRRPLAVNDLLARIQRMEATPELSGWAESMEALVSKPWPMTYGVLGKPVNSASGTFDVRELFEPPVTIVYLSTLPDDGAKNMLSQIILKEAYDETKKRGKSETVRLAVVLDEASISLRSKGLCQHAGEVHRGTQEVLVLISSLRHEAIPNQLKRHSQLQHLDQPHAEQLHGY